MSLPVFLEYLVASVARVRPGFGRQTLDCHARAFRIGKTGVGGEFDIAALVEAFVYDLERQAEPLVLVIDDLRLAIRQTGGRAAALHAVAIRASQNMD
jgi:ATP/maltotriose-dependent transcriptional regulator MalT